MRGNRDYIDGREGNSVSGICEINAELSVSGRKEMKGECRVHGSFSNKRKMGKLVLQFASIVLWMWKKKLLKFEPQGS